jgi:hypothetical protein
MCFGGDEKVKTVTSNPDPQVQAATSQNLGWLSSIQNAGMPGLPDNRIGDFGPLQQQAFGQGGSVAGDPQYLQRAQALVNQYTSDPAGNIQTKSLAEGIPTYMDPQSAWVQSALTPQLTDLEHQRDAANHADQASATMAGAFGDPRAAIQGGITNSRFDNARAGLIGNAYQTAYDRAIGASAQDVANKQNADTANAGLKETFLNRLLTGANANTGLQSGQMSLAQALSQLGQPQTEKNQAQAQIPFQDWMIKNLQWIPQIAQLMNQGISAGTKGLPSNQVTTAPDNSGFGAIGSIAGSVLPYMLFSDVQLKEEVEAIGELFDGTPVYSYRYVGDPVTRIGLMAQDIEERVPEAVHDIGGFKAVDYDMATQPARKAWLADAFGLAA